jgi:hypothetical protein
MIHEEALREYFINNLYTATLLQNILQQQMHEKWCGLVHLFKVNNLQKVQGDVVLAY